MVFAELGRRPRDFAAAEAEEAKVAFELHFLLSLSLLSSEATEKLVDGFEEVFGEV